MPVIRVDNAGQIGIVKDVPSYELPPNAWSDGQNVRMADGSVWSSNGYESLWSTPQIAPYKLYPVQTPQAYYWLYCGLNKVYAIQSQYHHEITRLQQPTDHGTGLKYAANAYYRWGVDNLNGVIVLNNATNIPQYWEYPINHNNKLQDITGWPSGDRCIVLRAFKNFLVAGNINRSGTDYPMLIKWSHAAALGSVPSSWDETDPTLDAGENALPHNGGDILDMKVLRDTLIIYRTNSTWAMSFIGAPAIFRFWSIFDTSGILARECVSEFYGSHFVVTQDDVIVHDGQNIKSVIDDSNRTFLFSDISSDNFHKAFVVHYQSQKEMWICYPTGSGDPDRALVWNYNEGNWAIRELPGVVDVAYGVVDEDSRDAWDIPQDNWPSQTGSWASATAAWSLSDVAWDADDKPWNARTFDPQKQGLIYADADAVKLWHGDTTNQDNGVNRTSYVERRGLAIAGQTDHFIRKHIRAIYPHVEGTDGGVLNVYCGWQDYTDSSVTWSTAQQFTIGSDYRVDFNIDGRLIAVKFESTTDIDWRLSSYQIDLEVSGER